MGLKEVMKQASARKLSKSKMTLQEIDAKKIRNEVANKHTKNHVSYENNFKFEGPKAKELNAAQKNERNRAKRARKN